MKRVISAVQPTGELHIGNYLGSIKSLVEIQHQDETFVFIADYHSLTVRPKPATMIENSYHVAAMLIGLGIDPKSTVFFLQSAVPAQTELTWILGNFVSIGQLNRMTQYKEKAEKHGQNAGLLTYPILMAADIAAYQATDVPVGDDQTQHLELSREIIRSFNAQAGTRILVEPQAILSKSPRVMSLNNPMIKMSKSVTGSAIGLLDSEEVVARTIRRAVTDSDPNSASPSPALSNLFAILEGVSDPLTAKSCREAHKNGRLPYSELKELLTEEVISFLRPVQKTYHNLISKRDQLDKILKKGADRANLVADSTLREVKRALGVISVDRLDKKS